MDPNWFYHDVVGQVLNIDEACHIEVHQKKLTIKNNIIEIYKLKEFKKNSISIKKELQPSKGCPYIVLNFDNLIETMIKMHVCFEQDLPNSGGDRVLEQKCHGLFIRTMLLDDQCANNGNHKLKWGKNPTLSQSFVPKYVS